MNRNIQIIVGILIWCGLIGLAGRRASHFFDDSGAMADQLTDYLVRSKRNAELEFQQPTTVRVGDPIMLYQDGRPRWIGVIRQVQSPNSTETQPVRTQWARAQFFSSAPRNLAGAELRSQATPDSLVWAVKTMLPPETRKEIARLIVQAFQDHRAEIARAMEPVFRKTLVDAADVIRDELRLAWMKRQDQIDRLVARYQEEVFRQKLQPLIEDEIWPVIQSEATPLAIQIGQELWQEVSLWRFGWRILVDKLPTNGPSLTEREFKRFVEDKARPILLNHIEDAIDVQKRILAQLLVNPQVEQTMSETFQAIAMDPEFQQLMFDLFQDVFVNNERLERVLKENWNTPEAQQALVIVNTRLEPTITQIGATLFGSPDTQITPQFARVLRNRIMRKDARWFELRLATERAAAPVDDSDTLRLVVKPADQPAADPFFPPSAD